MQPLLFGVDLSTSAAPNADPLADGRAAERLGFDFVSASDHPSGSHPTYETWTLLAWIAAATTQIHVASRVLSLPFRAPALGAKMSESLDRLSGGRLILGLGAGAADDELRGFGLAVPSAREKVDGLGDALQVVRGLWSEPDFTHRGQVHSTDAALLAPKANRQIPIWLGTYGDRALQVTGRFADGWIPSLGYVTRDQLIVMLGKILTAADAAGRCPDDVRCVLNVAVHIGADRDAARPELISGSANSVAEQLSEYLALGFSGFNLMPEGTSTAENLQRFATDVMPTLRAL